MRKDQLGRLNRRSWENHEKLPDPSYILYIGTLILAVVIFTSNSISSAEELSESHKKGIEYIKEGKLNEAIVELKKAIELAPNFYLPHSDLGLAYENKGVYDDATKEYAKALDINPSADDARNNLGGLYSNLGRLDEAIIEHKKAIKANNNSIHGHYGLGMAYAHSGRIDDANKMGKKVHLRTFG